ncbi:MAG TPA: hypothetical protein VJ803_03900 [Gemmatimonadaceae bacterium]|jgi:hypothetical protein|nr:hypothetical protein [Gemmatimonadaceae bacterium]
MTTMQFPEETVQPHIATINVGGVRYNVSVRVSYDGVEFLGRLWFAEAEWEDVGIPDRAMLPGRSKDEVMAQARRLSEDELVARHRRAAGNRRRYLALRAVTEEALRKIRYLNQVAVSMRAGLIDVNAAAQEIDLTERQLHELVRRLRTVAGAEEQPA